MGLPKDLVQPDYNYTFPSERDYFDETGSTLAAGRVVDPTKSGKDYGIKDVEKTKDIDDQSGGNGGGEEPSTP